MRPLLPTLLASLALSACSPRVLQADGWSLQAEGMEVRVRLVPSKEFRVCAETLVGCTVPLGDSCLIMLDAPYFLEGTPRQRTLLLAHEFGHCLDGHVLKYSHNRFGEQGTVYGEYYRSAVEGFAEAYARAFIAKCGYNLASLGFQQGERCEWPDPSNVKAPPSAS